MISIIIPTSNEARQLPRTLAAIRDAGTAAAHEILVVDAASNDETVAVANSYGARVLMSGTRQRATQMNLGAEQARGDVFLFLHGDTTLPARALAQIEDALADGRVSGGAFARRYRSRSCFLRATCGLAYLRGRHTGWFLGDQAIFVRAEIFQKLTGFQNFDLFEDLDFSRRLHHAGKTVILRPAVISAARRFERRGPWRTTWSDFILTVRYLRGISPHELATERNRDRRGETVYEGT